MYSIYVGIRLFVQIIFFIFIRSTDGVNDAEVQAN